MFLKPITITECFYAFVNVEYFYFAYKVYTRITIVLTNTYYLRIIYLLFD
ncbi:unnamed protein product [Cercospora beticola]|nr:unnamed protein product [Cercospora beticola]